jgi:hypothetical protein
LECAGVGKGFLTRFRVAKRFPANYPVEDAGRRSHQEYWLPAEDLPAFNAAPVGEIEAIAEYP